MIPKQATNLREAVTHWISCERRATEATARADRAERMFERMLDDLTAADDVTPGWMKAPFEPTEAMYLAAEKHVPQQGPSRQVWKGVVRNVFQSMMTAAQSTKGGQS
jgi:hypothetical protein